MSQAKPLTAKEMEDKRKKWNAEVLKKLREGKLSTVGGK